MKRAPQEAPSPPCDAQFCEGPPRATSGGDDLRGRAGRGALLATCAALPRVDLLAVLLGQPAPDAVRLAHREPVLPALLDHRAAHAHLDGGLVALATRRAALTLGVEEEARVGLTAGAVQLPLPHLRHGDGKTGKLGHGEPPGSDPSRVGLVVQETRSVARVVQPLTRQNLFRIAPVVAA